MKLIILKLLLFVIGINGLFEDQVGTYDWRQQYVGRPLFSKIDLNKNRVYLATNKNLICSLNRINGEISELKVEIFIYKLL
jgi:hypothetical protein